MSNKKNILTSALIIFISALLITVIPTDVEAAIYEDTIRLHILANSDTEYDQTLKIKLRDAILEKFGTRLQGYTDKREAESMLTDLIDGIELYANDTVRNLGYSYDVKVTMGEEWYDTRVYDDFTLPKGYYTSLIISIGEGKGQNWWCVMYPPMCLDICVSQDYEDDALIGYNRQQTDLISSSRYNVKFKILELISEIGK